MRQSNRNIARMDRLKKRTWIKRLPPLDRSREFAQMAHNECNSYFQRDPYFNHLTMVVDFAIKHIKLISEDKQDNVIAACWCHDILWTTRKKYPEILKLLGIDIAELIRKVTPDIRGRNENEMFSPAIMKEIYESKEATFIRVCDRIAETFYARKKDHSLYIKLKSGYRNFVEKLYRPDLEDLFIELEKITD